MASTAVRAPFQVLVIPFRRTATGVEFAVLRRSDADWWQFVAGGGEGDETPAQAAARETEEEIGIAPDGPLVHLDSMATVPRDCFAAAGSWLKDMYVIPEHCFAINSEGRALKLSHEHTDLQWVSYHRARQMLKWDSFGGGIGHAKGRISQFGRRQTALP